jgi:probable F420-dependent oxidoreductase
MRRGIAAFPTTAGLPIHDIAARAEALGYDSLFVPEHSHIPAAEATFPNGAPVTWAHGACLDPFVALTAAAMVTSVLRLGTGVALLAQRDVFATAKQVASLDVISGGRAELGIAAGWNRQELRDHGVDPRNRVPLMLDKLAAIRALWAGGRAGYHGEFVDFDACRQEPGPLQSPHPPVLIGGGSDAVVDRVLDHADGWCPVLDDGYDVLRRVPVLRARAAARGRPVTVSVFIHPSAQNLAACQAAGVDRALLWFPADGSSEQVETLQKWAPSAP